MSGYVTDADAAMAYRPPADLPIIVYAVIEGQVEWGGGVFDSIDILWGLEDRPGTFTARVIKEGPWQMSAEVILRFAVWEVQSLYALLGGWPEPEPVFGLPGGAGFGPVVP